MPDTFVQEGNVLDFTVGVTGAAVSVPQVCGTMIGVPMANGIDGDVVPCIVKGVVNIPLKAAGADPAFGDPVTFEAGAGEASLVTSAVSGDLNTAGKVAADGLGTDAFVVVLLTPETAALVP